MQVGEFADRKRGKFSTRIIFRACPRAIKAGFIYSYIRYVYVGG